MRRFASLCLAALPALSLAALAGCNGQILPPASKAPALRAPTIVKAGELLITLEDSAAVAQVAQARSAVAQAETRLRQVTRANDILGSVFQQLNIRSEAADGPPLRSQAIHRPSRSPSLPKCRSEPCSRSCLSSGLRSRKYAIRSLGRLADGREATAGAVSRPGTAARIISMVIAQLINTIRYPLLAAFSNPDV